MPIVTKIKTLIKKGGTLVGKRRILNFIEGTNVTITAADNPGTRSVDVTINGPSLSGYQVLVSTPTSGDITITDGSGQTQDSGKTFSTDGTMSANSDNLVPTQKAARTYADSLVVGLWDDRGNFDASGGSYPSTGGSGTAGAILKGDIWTISVAGTLPTGQVVEVGDTVRALINTPGNTQANWSIQQNNIGYVPENVTNKDTDGTLSANSDTKYPSQKAVKTYVDSRHNLYFSCSVFSPLANTTYFLGGNPAYAPLTATSASRRIVVLKTGTLTTVGIQSAAGNTPGSDSHTIKIKNVTTGNSITLTTALIFVSGFYTGLKTGNLAVNAGDLLEVQWVAPTSYTGTAPTGVTITGWVLVE